MLHISDGLFLWFFNAEMKVKDNLILNINPQAFSHYGLSLNLHAVDLFYYCLWFFQEIQ